MTDKEILEVYEQIRKRQVNWPGDWDDVDNVTSYDNGKPSRLLVKFMNQKGKPWEIGMRYKSIWVEAGLLSDKTAKVTISEKEFNSVDCDLGWGSKVVGKDEVYTLPSFSAAIVFIYRQMLTNEARI